MCWGSLRYAGIMRTATWATLQDAARCCSDSFLDDQGDPFEFPEAWDGELVGPWFDNLSDDEKGRLETMQMVLSAAQEFLAACCNSSFSATCTLWPCVNCGCGAGDCSPCPRPKRVLDFSSCITWISSIEQIIFHHQDGSTEILDPSMYRVDNGCQVVLHSPTGDLPCWPKQDRNITPGEPGTWSITMTIGEPGLANLARLGLAELACSWFSKVSSDESSCCDEVDKRATSMSKNGIRFELAQFQQLIKDGQTGCDFADAFLKACKETHMASGFGMHDPAADYGDGMTFHEVTWQAPLQPVLP